MSKNKKKRKHKKYNQTQFINVVCTACAICEPASKPTFCKVQYEKNPKRFMEKCYPRLYDLDTYSQKALLSDKRPSAFQDIFCRSNMCGNNYGNRGSCSHLFKCMSDFTAQTTGKKVTTVKRRKGRKDKSKKYVCQPYPTFFSNDNQIWQKKIRSVLIHEGNDIKSDKTEAGARRTEGKTNSKAEDQ